MKRVVTILILAGFLSGCMSAPAVSLDQRLAGKSDAEARKILAYACYREAKWPLHNSSAYKNAGARRRSQMDNNPGAEYRELVSLCSKMRVAPEEVRASLADDCQILIEQRSRRYGAKAADHIRRVAEICKRMTGQPVGIAS
jgi:hypothetical protein